LSISFFGIGHYLPVHIIKGFWLGIQLKCEVYTFLPEFKIKIPSQRGGYDIPFQKFHAQKG